GCRANKGVKAPGAYYYETTVLEDGPVRVGWATNGASLNLGEDDLGIVFGTEDGSTRGLVTFNGDQFDFGAEVRKGDVIGCYIDFDHGVATWNCNGAEGAQPVRIPDRLLNESFFPGKFQPFSVTICFLSIQC
ncbi:unnamed protein product, partial [Dibothriocephalus latus]